MKRFYHNQKFRIIPRTIIDFAIEVYRMKYPSEIHIQKPDFLSVYKIVKGMSERLFLDSCGASVVFL
jgi:hypothetical protein